MRRIHIFSVFALILSLLTVSFTYSQPSPPPTQTGQTGGQTANVKGRALVKRLPANLEGVELKEGGIRAKPGYKFFTKTDGTVLVARLRDPAGGSNSTGTPSKTAHANDPGDDDDHMSSGELAALILLGVGAAAGILYASRTNYSCSCASGGCKAVNSGDFLYCDKSDQNACKDRCILATVRAGKKTQIMSY